MVRDASERSIDEQLTRRLPTEYCAVPLASKACACAVHDDEEDAKPPPCFVRRLVERGVPMSSLPAFAKAHRDVRQTQRLKAACGERVKIKAALTQFADGPSWSTRLMMHDERMAEQQERVGQRGVSGRERRRKPWELRFMRRRSGDR